MHILSTAKSLLFALIAAATPTHLARRYLLDYLPLVGKVKLNLIGAVIVLRAA